MKKKIGFTLVELLVVISIIAILLAVLIPSMNKARETARRVICGNHCKQLAMGVAAYASDCAGAVPWNASRDPSFKGKWYTSTLPPLDNERHLFLAYSMGTTDDSDSILPQRWGCLHARGLIKDGKVFYCPSYKTSQYRYDDYIVPLPPDTDRSWGFLPQKINESGNQWVRTAYDLFPIDPQVKKIAKRYYHTARKFERITTNAPIMSDRLWNTTRLDGMEELAHRQGTLYAFNAAFKDGHVVYVKGQKTIGDGKIFDKTIWDTFGMDNPKQSSATYVFHTLLYEQIIP